MSEQDSHTEFTTGSTPSQVQPSKIRRFTSKIWNEFEVKNVDGQDLAICNTCNAKLKATSKNGTQSLHEHVKSCKKKMGVELSRNDGGGASSNYNFDADISRRELANAIILHEYPLSIVEHNGFRRFVNSLNPLFKMVSRNTIKSDILKIYESEKAKTLQLFDKLESRVAITTDMWTAKPTKRGFMAITAHFIDESWTLHNQILRFIYVPSPHNKEVLSEVLIDALLDSNLDRKLSTITVDNATTNDAMIPIVRERLSTTTTLLLDEAVLHMRCCAHILNLIVQDGLDTIRVGAEKIRNSVVFWIGSQQRMEKFEETAKNLRVPCTKKLVLDVPTRWNSTYSMFRIALLYKDVFPRLKQREKYYTSLPTEEDWNLVKEISDKLELFYSVTVLFSRTNYPTANCYFPKICEIKVALREWLGSPLQIIREMATNMMEKFNKYWSVCHHVMGIACVLDPRYKMRLVEYYFQVIYGSEAWIHVEKIRESCYELLKEYQSKCAMNESVVGSSFESPPAVAINSKDSLAKYDIYVNSLSTNVLVKSEMDFYLEEHVLPRTPNFDMLSWWKTNGVKFPTLQRIARDILAIPVSTVASESAFSTSGRLISPHQSRLHHLTVEALMCAQNWLWKDANLTCSSTVEASPHSIMTTFNEDVDDTEGIMEFC